jgi:uncharacterized protein (DUF58 family)
MPARRLLILFLLTAPLVAFGDVGRVAALGIVVLLAAAAGVDWFLARDIVWVTVQRAVEDKLSLGEWNPITLTVTNGTARAMTVALRDVVPPDFLVEQTAAAAVTSRGYGLEVPARGQASLTYRVRPRHRGDHRFGDLYRRIEGPLGLVHRQRRQSETGKAVRVYPSLRQLRRYELLVRRGMMLEAGAKAIRAPGASTEFERLREYVPDDEFRRINWKATARRGKMIVNQFETERAQNVVIMIDAGRLMGARTQAPVDDESSVLLLGETATGLTKLDHALNAALLLAYVATVRGDRVALLSYAHEVQNFIPPARGRRAFLQMVDAFYNLAPAPVEPDHALAFQFLATRNLRRSLVVLFTDLADRESSTALVANILRASRQHLVVCVTLGDPTVTRPALATPTDTPSLYEKMIAQRLIEERAAVLATLSQRGVYTLDTDADRLSPSLIESYLEIKQRGRI